MISEVTRRQYLRAMGIDVWCLRTTEETALAAAPVKEPIRHVQPDSASSPTELFRIEPSRLEAWLAEQCLLKIRAGDVGVNTLGDPDAGVMVLSQCLVRDKLSHQPFSGSSGNLLRAMLKTLALTTSDILIGELDTPHPDGKRLTKHLAGKNVRTILLLVDLPARHSAADLKKLRQRVFMLENPAVKILVSFHPDYLLANPKAKAQAWEDLKLFKKILGEA
ncbi:MAG: hypothetical protein KDJ38_13125 [Gammaproteobacteria bacterium]|nr:hypothetical protein [Gammaproteobacteria bacterium]